MVTCQSVKDSPEYRLAFRKGLFAIPFKQLEMAVQIIKEHSDHKGRLHSERSGERARVNGMSEIERLIAFREERCVTIYKNAPIQDSEASVVA